MNITRTVILPLLFTLSLSVNAEIINFCKVPSINQKWERLIKKNSSSPEWQAMYQLRKELCNSVDSGRVTLEDAIEQFEIHRAIMVDKLRERIEKKHGKQTGTA